jgi:uncharacterized protein (TIGR03067 family)
MKPLAAFAMFVGVFSVSVAADKSEAFAGKWVIESAVRDGKDDAGLKGAIRIHDGENYSVTPAEGSKTPPVKGTFMVDVSKTPATIDMKPTTGRYKDKVLLGIAKIDGDNLVIAFAEPGKDRPTAFESKEGTGVVLAVHRKAK